jgi:hypothetical protein
MARPSITVGVEVGDRHSHLCLIDTQSSGEVLEESRISTSPTALERRFSGSEPMWVAIEVGTHSPSISRLLEGCGHEVLVTNARKLRLIHAGSKKSDRLDAENLARLARLDPRLLFPIEHRGEASQAHVALVRSRDVLIGTRTKLVNHVLGPFGEDSDLRRHGPKIAERGGKNAEKRAVVAVARKLSVLLHRLWITGEVYEPLYDARRTQGAGAA